MNESHPITVLYVDDDPDFASLTSTMLKREGEAFEVITETDPRAVLPLLDEHDIDCLVSDYKMPEMDGIDLLERVREADPILPVILFTAKGTEAVASRSISAGVTEYLRKERATDQFAALASRIANAVEHTRDERRRRQYRTVVEAAGDAIYVLDCDGHIELVNESFERLFDVDRDVVVGSHIAALLSDEHAAEAARAVDSLRWDGDRNTERFTFETTGDDGMVRIHETIVSLVEQNGFAGSVGIVRDITDEQRAEKLLTGLFDQSLYGIGVKEIITDDSGEPVDYVYKEVNEQFEELTGLAAEEVIGRRATDVLDGIEETPFIEIFGDVALNGTTAQFEQYSAPLGRHYEVSAFSPRYGECISIFADITERKQRERELERYEQLIKYSPELLVVLDEELNVSYQSPPSPLFEWEPREIDDKNLFGDIHPDDRKMVSEHVSKLLQNPGEIANAEFRGADANGQWQWIESRGQNFLGDEPIDGIFAAMRDISDRKQQEAQLAQYSEILKQLQKTTRTLLETNDVDEAARQVIASFEAVFEYELAGIWLRTDSGEALKPIATSKAKDDYIDSLPTYTADTDSLSWEAYEKNELRYIRDMSTAERRVNPETSIRSEVIAPLGSYGVLNIGSIEPDAFSDRELDLIRLWAETLTVVFARLAQLAELEARQDALTRERDRLDEFAGIISHDLRNPLSVASGYLQLAIETGDTEPLGRVETAHSRMEELIEDILLLAREGDIIGDRTAVALADVCTAAWENVDTAEAVLRIETELRLVADESRLVQLMENLLRNCITHGGADVTVTVGELDGGFYIEDTGDGLPEGMGQQLFDSGVTTDEGGTGIGLRVVKQIVDAHGWAITATAGTEEGARFEITGIETDTDPPSTAGGPD